MGHFTHNCKLSGLPITGNAVLIVMKPQPNLWDNSEESLKKYGKTYLCSNDGTRLKFIPYWFPIKGEYNDYGSLQNIIHDDNTKILEEFYGLSIENLIEIITSSRKDDGFDSALDFIKKQKKYPSDWIEGEEHIDYYSRTQNDPKPFDGNYPYEGNKKYFVFRNGKKVKATKKEYDDDYALINDHYSRYNTWKKNNPDPNDDYGNPQYEEKYKELLTLSGMWIHGDLYNELTNTNVKRWKDSLDLGIPIILNELGFKELPEKGRGRYNRKFEKDGLVVKSDGTWLEIPNQHIYRLKDFKEYCKKKKVEINIEELDSKDYYTQIFDYILPSIKVPKIKKSVTKEEINEFKEKIKNSKLNFSFEDDDEIKRFLQGIGLISNEDPSLGEHLSYQIFHKFLNYSRYGSLNIENPLTPIYIQNAKEGKLRDNFIRFCRFDEYMFACGKFYDIVGTGPQDGEYKVVLKVLETATSILKKEMDKLGYNDEEE